MTYPLVDSMNMKLNPNSTRPRIFDGGYTHPWYKIEDIRLIRPNPPTPEAVEKAKFVDKTYHWEGGGSVRSRNERSTK